jgi:hypothetical protein
VGVSVSLGRCNLAQPADLNPLSDHLTALIGHVQPNQAILKFLSTGVAETTALRLWLKPMACQCVLATTSARIPDSPK